MNELNITKIRNILLLFLGFLMFFSCGKQKQKVIKNNSKDLPIPTNNYPDDIKEKTTYKKEKIKNSIQISGKTKFCNAFIRGRDVISLPKSTLNRMFVDCSVINENKIRFDVTEFNIKVAKRKSEVIKGNSLSKLSYIDEIEVGEIVVVYNVKFKYNGEMIKCNNNIIIEVL